MKLNRLLIVGSDQVWSIERIYLKHLRRLNINTEIFEAQNFFYSYYNKSLFNKLIHRAGLSSIYRQINKELLNKARTFRPDVIWFFKGMEIFPSTLEQLRKEGFVLVNYNPDNPFYFSASGSGNKNITNSIEYYHAHFTYDRNICDQIIKRYQVPCFMLPFGFELHEELYEECTRQDELNRLCFIGNPDKDRVLFLEQLANYIPIDVYGHGWDKKKNLPANINCCGAVYGDDFWKTLYRYRVQLNLMRPHNPASHNMRSFEIPGVGGIGLYPYTLDHYEYFGKENNVFLFNDLEDCAEKAKMILNLTTFEAQQFRQAARNFSIANGYTYTKRAEQVVDILKWFAV